MTLAFARRIEGDKIEICADKRITSEDGSYNDGFDKIIEGENYTIVFAGNPAVGGIILSMEEVPGDLYELARVIKSSAKEIMNEVDFEMIVVVNNSIYRIDSECIVQEYEESAVIGSGEQYATYLVEKKEPSSSIYTYVSSKINDVSPDFVTVVV